jgi:hypothetical protein
MKNKLWIFGDSFSDKFQVKEGYWANDYIEWKGYIPKVYGEILSEKLDMDLNLICKSGICNYTIFENICNNIHKIGKNDIVIINWSKVNSFRIVEKNHTWKSIIPSLTQTHKLSTTDELSEITLNEIGSNRFHGLYAEEVNSWMKLINFALKENQIIHWQYFDNPVLDAVRLHTFTKIREETNGEIQNGHAGEKGQIEISIMLLNLIDKDKLEKSIF